MPLFEEEGEGQLYLRGLEGILTVPVYCAGDKRKDLPILIAWVIPPTSC